MDDVLTLDPTTTALLLLDLQKSVVGNFSQPHASEFVVTNAASLAERCRTAAALVVHVHTAFSINQPDRLLQVTDSPPPPPLPSDGADFVPESAPRVGELVILKRQWGAFYGTELDLQLRRRRIQTLVLTGIATNFVVESTARDAFERGYSLIFAEDAMTSGDSVAHAKAIDFIFPKLGRVRSSAKILFGSVS